MRQALEAYRLARTCDARALEPNNGGNVAGDHLAAVLEQRSADLDTLLHKAIREWMGAPAEKMHYHWGNAQGIARTLSVLHATTFAAEWSRGLDNWWQNDE